MPESCHDGSLRFLSWHRQFRIGFRNLALSRILGLASATQFLKIVPELDGSHTYGSTSDQPECRRLKPSSRRAGGPWKLSEFWQTCRASRR